MNKKEIFIEMFRKGLIKTIKDKPEGWRLVSGIWSPFYIQLRHLPSHPKLLNEIGKKMGDEIKKYGNKLLGIAMAGIPIAVSISLHHGMPACYTRKIDASQLEKYGEHSLVEGIIEDGDKFIAVDDIVTKFDSKIAAIKQLQMEAERREKSIECRHVAVVIDRGQGASKVAEKYGIKLHSLINFRKAIEWVKDEMEEEEFTAIKEYLEKYG